MKRLRLASGLELYGLNQTDCEVLYQQHFAGGSRWREQLKLSPGDCVFDVGANVGLFSLALAREVADLQLYLFEPVPEVFAALEKNRALLETARSKAFQVALSNYQGSAPLTYSPHLSSMATLDQQAVETIPLAAWLRAVVADASATPPLPLLPKSAARSRALAYAAALRVAASIAAARAWTTRRTNVPLTTVSTVMRNERVERVDLLKIDVEGHELEVLQGIETSDWIRIRQLVAEVADVNGRLREVRRLLESRGYRVTVAQEPWELFRLHRLYNVYARR